MEKKFKFKLGRKVQDWVTGFVGVVVARAECLNGSIKYELQPEWLEDNRPAKTKWFDECRLCYFD